MSHAFTEVNIKAAAIGEALLQKAIIDGDIETLKAFRQCAADLYENLIQVVDTKPDFATWHALFLKLNKETTMNQLDTTGEFTRLVNLLDDIDAGAHYRTEVVPLFAMGKAPFEAERDMCLGNLDELIAIVIRRSAEDKASDV
jgi:hypothetical protein